MTKTDEPIATSLVATDAGWISRQDSCDSSAPAEPQNMNCIEIFDFHLVFKGFIEYHHQKGRVLPGLGRQGQVYLCSTFAKQCKMQLK